MTTSPPVYGIVPAAGRGRRFGSDLPKQFIEVGSRPILVWTLERLLAAGIGSITVALPPHWVDDGPTILADSRLSWVAGGDSRQDSVSICLDACGASERDLVLVHDGARPLVHPDDVAAVVRAAAGADGAVLGRPVADTLKLAADGVVQGTVDRSFLFRAETPQVFPQVLLRRGLESAASDGFVATDEASLIERLPGATIAAVNAQHPNPKLTDKADLELIAALLERASRSSARSSERAS